MQRRHQRVAAAFDVHHEEATRRVGFDLGPQDFTVGVRDPDVLNVLITHPLQLAFVHGHRGDFIWINTKTLGEPVVIELESLIFEHLIVSWTVEYLLTKHDEARVMATGKTNVVQIVETSAELRTDQRIGGRVELTSHAVWLEAEDTGGDVVDIVPPAGHDGVPLNAGARDACRG